jgi:radical SAM protein with 4Fe4S-binding SPASM domain
MKCLHCGTYATGLARVDELTTERALELVDELADMGLQRITLSGGEPLLRKDWYLIAERLMKKGIKTGMITNGWFIRENIEKIKSVGEWDVIGMSLDGMRRTHDAFRRTPGSFDRILDAFRLLKKNGIETACITCVSGYNFLEMDTIHDVLVTHGVSAWQIQPLFAGGRIKEHLDMLLDIKDLYEIAKFVARKRKVSSLQVFPADGMGYYSRFEKNIRPEGWSGCQAGLRVVGIEANGNIKGCLSLFPEAQENNPFVEGNVKEKSLREIWENPEAFAYNRRFDPSKAEGFCKECAHLIECRCGCTAEAFFSTGTKYNNPYCMHREISQNGEPEQKVAVPMTTEFERALDAYYQKADEEKKKKKAKPIALKGKTPGYKPEKLRAF